VKILLGSVSKQVSVRGIDGYQLFLHSEIDAGIMAFNQGAGLWTNETMGYYYQGLTDDGQFYISLYWPISTAFLHDDESAAPGDVLNQATASQESYDQYEAGLKADLNELEPADWTPDLTELGALVQTLTFQLQ
jgi:hypothetical protein